MDELPGVPGLGVVLGRVGVTQSWPLTELISCQPLPPQFLKCYVSCQLSCTFSSFRLTRSSEDLVLRLRGLYCILLWNCFLDYILIVKKKKWLCLNGCSGGGIQETEEHWFRVVIFIACLFWQLINKLNNYRDHGKISCDFELHGKTKTKD